MIIEKRQKEYWRMTCHKCHTVLLLDESDFTTTNCYGVYFTRVSTPCPVCGHVWDNIEQTRLERVLKEVEDEDAR